MDFHIYLHVSVSIPALLERYQVHNFEILTHDTSEVKPTTTYETTKLPDKTKTAETVAYTTITSLCPYTTTLTEGGNTYTKTYTSTSTIVTEVPIGVTETTKLPDKTKTAETIAYTTYTSLCPYTTTLTEGGNTYTKTYTSTSTIITQIPTGITETTKLPDQTKTAETVAYTTLTTLCPYYTTITEGGKTYTKTLTSTSTIVTKVPETIAKTVYTTSLTTAYETTDVYVTETCPVTSYTTVIHGSTTVVTKTDTKSISVTKIYTTTVSPPSSSHMPLSIPRTRLIPSLGGHPCLQHGRSGHHRGSDNRRRLDRLRVQYLRRHPQRHVLHHQVAAADDAVLTHVNLLRFTRPQLNE